MEYPKMEDMEEYFVFDLFLYLGYFSGWLISTLILEVCICYRGRGLEIRPGYLRLFLYEGLGKVSPKNSTGWFAVE